MASRRIFLDVEEAIARQVRRISYHDSRTVDKTILQETYDPFSGEVITTQIEPEFYANSADTSSGQYPYFFIKLLKSREDRFSGREVPLYGNWIRSPILTSPKAYEITLNANTVLIPTIGNTLTITAFQIRKVQIGNFIRLLTGNNIGTYTIDSISIGNNNDHTITVSNTIVSNIGTIGYNSSDRTITLNTDINTVMVGDIFKDSSLNDYPITAIDKPRGIITIGGVSIPTVLAGASIYRVGDVFLNTDLTAVRAIVLDHTKPVTTATVCGPIQGTSTTVGVTPPVPIDAYYLVRIDSKTKENHTDVLNRIWEEFNPPRTALPTIARSALSAEELLTEDTLVSSTIKISDTSKYSVGETIFLFDDLHPVMEPSGQAMERPFEAKILDIPSSTEIVLDKPTPNTFKIENSAKIVSNAEYRLFMFHFVDHSTKDNEGSQYWRHEFQFWVQIWVDRYEQPTENSSVVITDQGPALAINEQGTVSDINYTIEDFNGTIYIEE